MEGREGKGGKEGGKRGRKNEGRGEDLYVRI